LNFFALLSLEMMKVCHKQNFFENFRLKKCFELRDLLFGVKIAETHSKSLRITVCVGPAPDWLKKNFEAALGVTHCKKIFRITAPPADVHKIIS